MAEFVKPDGVPIDKKEQQKPRKQVVLPDLFESHFIGKLLEVDSHEDPFSHLMRVKFTIEMTKAELYEAGGLGWLVMDKHIRITQ